MNDGLKITYTYVFQSGAARNFDIFLDPTTLRLITEPPVQPPSWTLLKQNQCANCSLNAQDHPFCPVALNFAEIAEHFAHAVSHEQVRIVVTTEERTAPTAIIEQTPLVLQVFELFARVRRRDNLIELVLSVLDVSSDYFVRDRTGQKFVHLI